jgi:hypothetical protein
MIFNCKTVMKDDLKRHEFGTTNAIESFHSKLYRLIPKKQPLAASLRLVLCAASQSGRMLKNLFDFGVAPSYNKKPTTPKKRRIRKKTAFSINDGRAPDCNSAIFRNDSKKPEEHEYIGTASQQEPTPQRIELEKDIDEYMEDSSLSFDELEDFEERKLIFESIQDSEHEEKFDITENHDAYVKKMLGKCRVSKQRIE